MTRSYGFTFIEFFAVQFVLINFREIMTNLSSKCRLPGGKNNLKCSNFCPHLIYDDPYIFRVRSQRSQSHSFPCDVCIRRAKQQQQRPSTTKIQYQQRCSRLPPRPIDLEHINRPKTVPSQRITNNCNWDNFLNNQSKYGMYKNKSMLPSFMKLIIISNWNTIRSL